MGSGADLFRTGLSWEDSGTTGFSVDAVLTGLLARSLSLEEAVPGRTIGLDVTPAAGEERRPRAFRGDEIITGLGDIELPGKSAGEGLDEVGLASFTGGEDCVPRNNCDVGRSSDRLWRKGF